MTAVAYLPAPVQISLSDTATHWSPSKWLRVNIGLFLGLLLASGLSNLLFSPHLPSQFWPIWAAQGVVAYGLLVWGARVVPVLFLTRLLENGSFGHLPWGINLWASLVLVGTPWLGCWLLHRVSPHWNGFQQVRSTLFFLLFVVLLPALLGTLLLLLGARLLTHAQGPNTVHLILYWTLAQSAAFLNVTVLLLILLRGHGGGLQRWRSFLAYALLLEGTILLLFFQHFPRENLAEAAVILLIFPFLWLLATFSVKLVYPLALFGFLTALLATSRGFGPYANPLFIFPETTALLVGMVMETIGLIAGAMMTERGTAILALERAKRGLEDRLAEHSRDLRERNRELQIRDSFLQSVTEINRLFANVEDHENIATVLVRFCQILVEHMHLAAVWIGHNSSGDVIQIAAHAGPLGTPLSQLQIYVQGGIDAPPSPSGRAIAEQRTLLFEANDPLFAPWFPLIQKYQMGGSIYTPFSWPDGSHGVLSLYRYANTAFPNEIVDLLERLGDDLAAFLRQRQVTQTLHAIRTLQKTMLSAGDIALRARDGAQMLQEICDALVHSGLFNAAFIVRPNAEGVFEALAMAGPNVDWILARRWTIDPQDIPNGQSLTSRAWRENTHLVIADYLGLFTPHTPWHEQATENHWRSVATLPIVHLEERWAMLNVVSDRVDFFDGEIMEVMHRIALLVGHGLDEIHLKAALSAERQRQSHLAQHDALTGLPNRRGLSQFLQAAMARAQRKGHLLAVAMLDLDDFKPVNDQYGHAAGDALLQEVAKRLREALRQSDHVARLGGDEFVLVWDMLQSREQVSTLLQKVGHLLAQPFALAELPAIRVRLSAGVTFYPQPEIEPGDADLLLRQADHALYQAKEDKATRSQYWCFFADQGPGLRQQMVELLRAGKVVLQYQPIVDALQDRIVGVEALARLANGERAISPGDFLPFLSSEDQWTLSEQVLQQIAQDWRLWQEQGSEIWVSLNIPPSFLANAQNLQRLRKLLHDCRMPPTALLLEILESDELLSLDFSALSIRQLQQDGYRVGLDDVGTGYASLLYMKELPVDEIKIDQAFVLHLGESPNDLHFLHALLELGRSQGLQVVVEGVETRSIRRVLLAMQAPFLQGFAIARPMFAEAIPDWLQHRELHRDHREDETADLLQLYAEALDYQTTIQALLRTNPAWLQQISSRDAFSCPLDRSISGLSLALRDEILHAHQQYHQQLEICAASLAAGKSPEVLILQAAGKALLQSISTALQAESTRPKVTHAER